MTVRDLYNRLQELPLERFDDEVKIWYADGDRFDVDFVDDTIDGVIELNVGPYDDGYGKDIPGFEGTLDQLKNL